MLHLLSRDTNVLQMQGNGMSISRRASAYLGHFLIIIKFGFSLGGQVVEIKNPT